MRVGIITLPFNNNYGGYLQAYALSKTISSFGHSPTVLFRLHNKRPLIKRLKYFIKSLIKLSIGQKRNSLFMSQVSSLRNKGIKMMTFVDKNIPLSKPLFSTRVLESYTKNRFDILVAGSDQCWRPDYGPCITDYFLKFGDKNVKRISYAASFGTSSPTYTKDEIIVCGEEIKKFKSISLREDSGIDVIKGFKWETPYPYVTLDPTMLLKKSDYETFFPSQPISNGFLCYVLDNSWLSNEIINRIETKYNIKHHNIIDPINWKKEDYIMPSIEEWLKSIHDADLVLTDSFHGTVFSIIFNRPFVVIANKVRGIDRFSTLLNHFGLIDRIVKSPEHIDLILANKIDWSNVNKLLSLKRENSLDYLRNALNN